MISERLLHGCVALVTGGGRGWGQSIALAYARQGAKVIVAARTMSEVDHTVKMITDEGFYAVGKRLDLSSEENIYQVVDEIKKEFGRLDILVNNAARRALKHFEDMSMDDLKLTLQVNLVGSILLCKLALPLMINQGGGSLINVSSNSGVMGFEDEVDYCTSKFALEGFSKALAEEVRGHNIAVNTITPGGSDDGVFIKPTNITKEELDGMTEEEQGQWSDSIVMTEAFVFLGLQRGEGVSGERILAYKLSEKIRQDGWDISYVPIPPGI
ncbi:MAG: SDR family oxidoreductase [Anaerolineaceae bacterium]|nr:SDR family oxidoreductase [Anaerolineaceae bacterium]